MFRCALTFRTRLCRYSHTDVPYILCPVHCALCVMVLYCLDQIMWGAIGGAKEKGKHANTLDSHITQPH